MTKADRQYHLKLWPIMAVYMATTIGISWGEKHWGFSPAALYGLSIIPIGALLLAMWVHWRYVKALDEYLFMIQVKGMMFGLAIMLAVSITWGLLEILANAPRLDILFLMVFFALGYSAATMFLTYGERRKMA